MPIIDGGSPWGLPEPEPELGTNTGRILYLAAQQLQDITGTKWSAVDALLPYLNLAITSIVGLKPDAYTVTGPITLVAGPTQEAPSGTWQIVDILCNLGADGITPGQTIRSLSKQKMDEMFTGWMTFTPTSPMTTPAAPTGAPLLTGGSIADGTYYYVITAVNQYGETVKGTQSAANVVSGGTGHASIPLTWTAVAGATSYRVYRTTSTGSYVSPCLVGSPSSNLLTDTLLTPGAGAPPTADSSGSAVIFVMIDDRNPLVFYVYPPPATPGVQKIQAILTGEPDQITAVDGEFPLDNSFLEACVDYIIYRALAEETTIPNALNKANLFYNKFIQDLGLRQNAEQQVEEKGQ